jgi:Holliday junction resolvase RusA-like endonuclease
VILSFFVDGKPQTAGSKVAVPIKTRNGRQVGMRVLESGGDAARESKKTWRQDLRARAETAMNEQNWQREHGPVVLEFVFHRLRPAGHYGSGRNERVLKPSAPLWPIGKPDALKLARAAEDALTGVVWADDAQVVDGRQAKVWACRFTGREGVSVTVRQAGPRDLFELAGIEPADIASNTQLGLHL